VLKCKFNFLSPISSNSVLLDTSGPIKQPRVVPLALPQSLASLVCHVHFGHQTSDRRTAGFSRTEILSREGVVWDWVFLELPVEVDNAAYEYGLVSCRAAKLLYTGAVILLEVFSVRIPPSPSLSLQFFSSASSLSRLKLPKCRQYQGVCPIQSMTVLKSVDVRRK
jgi:hypothetical protein